MAEFQAKLSQLRADLGLSRRAFGEALGVAESKIQKIEIGAQRADHEFLTLLSKTFSVDLNWLLNEKAENQGKEFPQPADKTNTDFVPIPRYDIEASAGYGSLVAGEEALGVYTFRKSWLKKRELKAQTLAVITVSGDSMEPNLYDGDRIVLDRDQTDLVDGRIYAVHFSDGLFIKRIQRLPGDTILLKSSNPQYSDIKLHMQDVSDDLGGGGFKIVGRVVASMHEW